MSLPHAVPRLRSLHDDLPIQVVFCNRSPRTVRLIWVNYRGQPQHYPTIPPGALFRMNTFLTHIWLFREVDTDVPLMVNKKEIYLPTPSENANPAVVHICLPVFTLKDRCLQVVRKLVKPGDFKKLEIVQSLYEDLENGPNVAQDLRRLAVGFEGESGPENL